jgi:hypothetical protein
LQQHQVKYNPANQKRQARLIAIYDAYEWEHFTELAGKAVSGSCRAYLRRGILGSNKSGKKRPVYVNGEYCKGMTSGAKKASEIVKREVALWEIQRILAGKIHIHGLTVSDAPPERKRAPVRNGIAATQKKGGPLLRYPLGERPLDRGIPRYE